MPTRYLNFSQLNTLFFILNILGHDVYHDFGSDSGRLIDSMAALNMINSFLGLAGGTKVKSQNLKSQRKPNSKCQLEYTTPMPSQTIIYITKFKKHKNSIRISNGSRPITQTNSNIKSKSK